VEELSEVLAVLASDAGDERAGQLRLLNDAGRASRKGTVAVRTSTDRDY
jgi:hypothetical protein